MPAGAFFRISASPSISMNLLKYLKETKAELAEVTFPSATLTISYTIAVVLLSLIVAAILGGTDFGLREGLTKLLVR
jgi:preprotein translocase SecE subunit